MGYLSIPDDAVVEPQHGKPWLKPWLLLPHDGEQDELQQMVTDQGALKVNVQKVLI